MFAAREVGDQRLTRRGMHAQLNEPTQGFTLGCRNEPFRLGEPKPESRETAPFPGNAPVELPFAPDGTLQAGPRSR